MLEQRKEKAESWFKALQNQICNSFEDIEMKSQMSDVFKSYNSGKFEHKDWDRTDSVTAKKGGGGQMRVMRGAVFEKVGVNVSTVYGQFPKKFRDKIPGAGKSGEFWASGTSLVAHTRSPLMPAVHLNTRMIVTEENWFGGVTDLNPMLFDYPSHEEDRDIFHKALKSCCDRHDPEYYSIFKKCADEYFYMPHRKIHRGVGGIFADYLWNAQGGEDLWEKHFAFIQDIGKTFMQVYPQILDRYMDKAWTDEQREAQYKRRGYYGEFNLVYDRGTEFGLKTDGNTEAILMSMPPIAKW